MKKWFLPVAAASLLLLAACGNEASSGGKGDSTDPNKPVEISTVIKSSADVKFPAGMDWDHNDIRSAFEDAAKVKLTNKWVVDSAQYANKLNVSIASQDIPDFFWVDIAGLNQLLRANMVMDLTDLWNKQASSELKARLNEDGGKQLKSATFDGKLMAIPGGGSPYDNAETIWIRQDWLKKLNMEPPRTMDDVINIARAFKEKDPDGNGKADTYGIALSQKIYDGIYDLTGYANGYHAYPKIWIKGPDGKLVYGSVQPEMKTALSQLQEMFKEGLIDREFGAKDENKENELLINGKIGMAYGKWWIANYPLNAAAVQDGKLVQDWKPYPIVSSDASPALSQTNLGVSGYYVISKKCKNPEAVMKLINTYVDVSLHEGEPEYEKYFSFKNGTPEQNSNAWKISPVTIFGQAGNAASGKLIPEAIQSGDTSKLVGAQMKQYEQAKKYMAGDSAYWGIAAAWGTEGSTSIEANYFDKKQFMYDEFYGGASPGMTSKQALLLSKETELFTKIIMNAAPVDDFDSFVTEWYKLGGKDMTDEVNKWYQSVQ